MLPHSSSLVKCLLMSAFVNKGTSSFSFSLYVSVSINNFYGNKVRMTSLSFMKYLDYKRKADFSSVPRTFSIRGSLRQEKQPYNVCLGFLGTVDAPLWKKHLPIYNDILKSLRESASAWNNSTQDSTETMTMGLKMALVINWNFIFFFSEYLFFLMQLFKKARKRFQAQCICYYRG